MMDSTGLTAFMISRLQAGVMTKMFDLAGTVIFLYDYLLTLGMEVEYVWPGPWTTIKVVYFIQRYIPFIDTMWIALHINFGDNLSPVLCQRLNTAGRALMCVGLTTSEVVLALMVIPAFRSFRFRSNSALYHAVYAEGVIYYFYLFIISIINILLFGLTSVDGSYQFLVTTLSRCLHSILTSRVLLHIRAGINEDQSEEFEQISIGDVTHRKALRAMKPPVGGQQEERPVNVNRQDGSHIGIWSVMSRERDSSAFKASVPEIPTSRQRVAKTETGHGSRSVGVEGDSCENYADDGGTIRGHLIFACFFSFVVGMFLTESYNYPASTHERSTTALISRALLHLELRTAHHSSPPFILPSTAARIHALWKLSLVLSVVVIITGFLSPLLHRAQQLPDGHSEVRPALIHAPWRKRYISATSVLLQVAILLFLAGLAEFAAALGVPRLISLSLVVTLSLFVLLSNFALHILY
ncbi:hypothetical protein NLJ89_g3104 [Agrocybe chaxingu]|uniref:Uncharacterized protein n=1 Tax=Agrocybe chaxingu TaxID=84603 RepID=A0A9W8K675_9AGAR|nr:hypothetical protein NLJ89_g3104 [Agrocybe chaxingu]